MNARGCGILCLALAMCGCAADRAWYTGASIGHVSTGVRQCPGEGNYTADTCSISNSGPGAMVFGGYQFNRYIAVEFGGGTLGTFTETTSGAVSLPPGVLPPTTETRTDQSRTGGAFVHAVGSLPLGNDFSAFTSLGPGPIGDVNVGAGLKYDITRKIAVRVEYQRLYGSGPLLVDWHADYLAAGIVFHFRK